MVVERVRATPGGTNPLIPQSLSRVDLTFKESFVTPMWLAPQAPSKSKVSSLAD